MSMKVIITALGYDIVDSETHATIARFRSTDAAAAHHALALEKLDRESEWMPVERIMPLEECVVQIYDPGKGVLAAFYTVNHKGEPVWETFDSLACLPTHWKPLSAPPG